MTTAPPTAPAGLAEDRETGAPAQAARLEAPKAPGSPVTAARYGLLLSSHVVIDIFPILLSVLIFPLKQRLDLNAWQVGFVVMATPIFSGLLQPVFARLTDKHDTRLCGPLGLAIGAVCIGSIGLAQTFWQLALLQVVGVIATGMYHPVSAALAGQSGTRLLRNGRAQALGLFTGAGMVGHAIGAKLGPWINSLNDGQGMPYLVWLIPPSLLLAVLLHVALRRMPHRHDDHHATQAAFAPGESARRWRAIAVLTAQNALRFTVNVGLLAVMANVWAKSRVLAGEAAATGASAASLADDLAIDTRAAEQSGSLGAALTIGMGVAVVISGRISKRGRERAPLLWLSVLGAAFTVVLGPLGDACHNAFGFGFLGMLPVYICWGLTSLGFFATFPIAAGLAQRLQPGHTGLVTSLMMGVGWGFSALSYPFAYALFGLVSLDDAALLEPWRINVAFAGFAALLLIAGAMTALIPRDLVAKAAETH